MDARQGQESEYLPPLPPRPTDFGSKQSEPAGGGKNYCEHLQTLWTKIPQQLQPLVKIGLIVLGCVLALVIAFLIGYDTAKSKYRVRGGYEESGQSSDVVDYSYDDGGECHNDAPDPSDCSHYYSCVNGVRSRQSCPSHHSFDPAKLQCVWIHLSTCGKAASTSSFLPTPAPPAPGVPPSLAQVKAQEIKITSQGEIAKLR